MRALFDAARQRNVNERAAFLEAACADDPSLADDVLVLLHAHDHAGGFLESPLVQSVCSVTAEPSAADRCEPLSANPAREGDHVSHYLLEKRLGEGGMGVVYLARDLALGRFAALKLLPDAFTPAMRVRLRTEADACARLQHPAIATYYESGEADGITFIAMEFVHGRSLRDRLRDGPLPLDEAVAVSACVLEGLSHAHAVGILHRDIKPENIILTRECSAKLVDFGLAQPLRPDEAATMTGVTGASVAGTIGYMSPEQIRNEPLDVRSDLFQVGAVLYEMLAGRPAFPGATPLERLAAVLTRDVPPIDGLAEVAGVDAFIRGLLARDRHCRYPTAGDALSKLMRLGAGGEVDLPMTLAVLDFHDPLHVAPDSWIGSGLADAVSSALSQASELTVVVRDRVLRTCAAATTSGTMAVEVGLALGCRWVLGGSFQRLGSALRVSTSLIETATGHALATDRYDGTLEQIFDIQDRIVAATCAVLAVEKSTRAFAPRPKVSAYECYARGQVLMRTRERGAFEKARALFEEAVQFDPSCAQALAGLARASALRYPFTTDPADLETAVEYAERAIRADPNLTDGYVWLGYASGRLGHLGQSISALRRCRHLNPREVFGYYFAFPNERWIRSPAWPLRLLRRAVEIDPHFGLAWWALGGLHFGLMRYPEATSCFERCSRLKTVPGATRVPGVDGFRAECLRHLGRLEEARALCLVALDDVERSDFMYRDTNRVLCLVTLGRTAMDESDLEAADAAFHQAVAHIRGRPRMLAGGFLFVQALAGLARVHRDASIYSEACAREAARRPYDFSWLVMCDEIQTCAELAGAARAFGRDEDARRFTERSRPSRARIRRIAAAGCVN